jgi:hypothetical protein
MHPRGRQGCNDARGSGAGQLTSIVTKDRRNGYNSVLFVRLLIFSLSQGHCQS